MPETKPYCYINGKIVTADKISISPYDIGLMRGYAIYEGITTRNRKIFYLKEHLSRFKKSAKALGIKIPITDKEITKILDQLIKKNGFSRTNFRVILTGGEALNGIELQKNKATFLILSEKWKKLSDELYERGGSLITHEHQRFMPEIKTTNYITAVKLQPKRRQVNAIEILFTFNGKVLECSTSNIFLFKNNKLITPKNNVLGGITKMAVIDSVKTIFKIEERDVTLQELLNADEVFITSSYKDIVPIVKIDGKKIKKGLVGESTKLVMKLFSEIK
jgi:branched-chain amino acid aminotransferase